METLVVVKQNPSHHKMSLDEFLFDPDARNYCINSGVSNTRTYVTNAPNMNLMKMYNAYDLIKTLEGFNKRYEDLFAVENRKSLYNEFYIPKRSGGLRKIDAPNDELMLALRELKEIFENEFSGGTESAPKPVRLYHTSAFAYVKRRSVVDANKRHIENESKWYAKFDLHDFFGSTTLEFVMNSLQFIFPFSEVMKNRYGREQLEKAISLGFLNGGLPQGTPLSPTLTNLMMIPIDFVLANTLRSFDRQRFVYTRYADDFTVSSKYDFDFHKIENLIVDTLRKYGAGFELNRKKTRYGSSSGANWNLGMMITKDNRLTIGHEKKRNFRAMLTNYCRDKKNGVDWDLHDVQVMDGLRNWYRNIEGDTIDEIVKKIGDKFGIDIVAVIKADLSGVVYCGTSSR